MRATLQLSRTRAWLVVDHGGLRSWCFSPGSSPADTLQEARRILRAAWRDRVDQAPDSTSPSVAEDDGRTFSLRLVLDGGFHSLSEVSADRGTTSTERALANLAAACPVELDQLISASLPVGRSVVWSAAFPTDDVMAWCDAAAELGIELEGIWTAASAMVERLLEHQAQRSFEWSDGKTLLTSQAEELEGPEGTGPAPMNGFAAIRVRQAFGPPRCTDPFAVEVNRLAPAIGIYPALAAHCLSRIDPSESFNLARAQFASTDLSRSRQRPLAGAMVLVALGLIVVGIAALHHGRAAKRRGDAYAQETTDLLKERQPAVSSSAMPLDALKKQLNLWRNARERGELRRRGGSQLAQLSAWFRSLPTDIDVDVRHLRLSGGELLVEGAVGDQAEVRELGESISKLPGAAANAVRATPTQNGVVGFSMRVSLATP